jgi:hypothetical protein
VEFADWLVLGQEHGWIGQVFCTTHDGPSYSDEEMELEEEWGEPPCVFAVRFYEDVIANDRHEVQGGGDDRREQDVRPATGSVSYLWAARSYDWDAQGEGRSPAE